MQKYAKGPRLGTAVPYDLYNDDTLLMAYHIYLSIVARGKDDRRIQELTGVEQESRVPTPNPHMNGMTAASPMDEDRPQDASRAQGTSVFGHIMGVLTGTAHEHPSLGLSPASEALSSSAPCSESSSSSSESLSHAVHCHTGRGEGVIELRPGPWKHGANETFLGSIGTTPVVVKTARTGSGLDSILHEAKMAKLLTHLQGGDVPRFWQGATLSDGRPCVVTAFAGQCASPFQSLSWVQRYVKFHSPAEYPAEYQHRQNGIGFHHEQDSPCWDLSQRLC
jgi:hypothetical protein